MAEHSKPISEINSGRLDKVEDDQKELDHKVSTIEATLLSHANGCAIQWKQYAKDMSEVKGFLQRQEARHNKLLWIFVSGFFSLVVTFIGYWLTTH